MKKSIIIIVAITIIAVVFYGIRYVKTPVDVQVAKAETIESIISLNGLIVHNENLYTAQNTGTFYSYTREGERVGKDRCVATVYDGVVDKDIVQSLNNIDKKISDIESENDTNNVYVTDEASVQILIESIKNDVIDAVIEEDVSKIYEYKNKLKAATGVDGEKNEQQSLTYLKEEKQEIASKITQNKLDIYSDLAGIYTTALDGLESVIKPDMLKDYKVEDYRKLKVPERGIMGNRTVQKGDPVCKVVDNHEWYAVGVISESDRAKINIGDNVKLRVAELPGDDVDAKIEYISMEEEGSKEYLVTVKCEKYLEGVFNIRESKIDIVLNSYFGYEIPVYAIHVKNGKSGVMVQGTDSEIFKECEILHRDDEKVIVKSADFGNRLQDGDKIVLGEK